MYQSAERTTIEKNLEYYNDFYHDQDIDSIAAKARDPEVFLARAARSGTWYGMYHDRFAQRIPYTDVLELGCGDGLNALIMASLGAKVTAIDISPESEHIIGEAASSMGLGNINCMTGDFLQLPLEPAGFDFVVGKAFLHHLTHDMEDEFLKKTATLLRPAGEARFVEPAVNNKILDMLRWIVPTMERPSALNKREFAKWKKEHDRHPERDNSSAHFVKIGLRHFNEARVAPYGSIDRFCRFLPGGGERFSQYLGT